MLEIGQGEIVAFAKIIMILELTALLVWAISTYLLIVLSVMLDLWEQIAIYAQEIMMFLLDVPFVYLIGMVQTAMFVKEIGLEFLVLLVKATSIFLTTVKLVFQTLTSQVIALRVWETLTFQKVVLLARGYGQMKTISVTLAIYNMIKKRVQNAHQIIQQWKIIVCRTTHKIQPKEEEGWS